MFNDFGNVNNMTKGQFKTAIEYYRNKITMINEDASLSPEAKEWFLERYNDRIKSLERTLQDLEVAINTAKSRGVLVNDETTTLSKLGSSSSATSNFDNLTKNANKHKVSQRWKIVGAILLPVVGTIPFLVSWRRAKKRHKEIETKLTQENIELGNFINHEKRPYEATLLTSTKFTDAEMANLLEDTVELGRIETLALTGTITPVEKKNLITKLTAVREFGQKNGYNVSAILTDPAFITKTDKNNNQITAHETTFRGIPTSAGDLKTAHDAIKQLQDLRNEVEALYNEIKDKRLKTLLNNIDTKIEALKTNAKTALENGVNGIVSDINGVTVVTTPATENDYTNAISDVDTKATAANTNFGTGVTADQAKKMAEEIGFDNDSAEYKKFAEIETARSTKKTGFETKLNELKTNNELNTKINNNLTLLSTHLTPTARFLIEALNDTNAQEFKNTLSQLKEACEFLKQNAAHLNATQQSALYGYISTLTTNPRISDIENKYLDFISKPENLPDYESKITASITASDIAGLTTELREMEGVLADISNADYKERMIKLDPHFGPKIDSLVVKATQKIDALKAKIELLTNSQTIQNQINIYNAQIPSSIPTDKTSLAILDAKMQEIDAWIKGVDLSKIDSTTNTNLSNLSSKTLQAQTDIAAELSVETLEDIAKEVNERFTNISKTSNTSMITNNLRDLSRLKNKLTRMRRSATTSDKNTINDLLKEIDDVLNGHPLAPGP